MSYIPTNTSTRKDCEALHTNKAGVYSELYQACLTKDFKYVLKVTTYDHLERKTATLKDLFNSWINEVKVIRKLNKKQEKLHQKFSPKLYDAWYHREGTEVHFYLLIGKYDGNLSLFFKDKRDSEDGRKLIYMTLHVMETYLSIIHDKTHICLNDIKLENILYKQIAPYDYELVFSDFGLSTTHTTEECRRRDREKFQSLIEEVALFDL